jgi:hypothetical protein
MSITEFETNPTHKTTGHEKYANSFFALQTMPENATSDALLGSLQRRLGLAVMKEGEVASCGSELLRRIESQRSAPSGALLDPGSLRNVLLSHLDSPASPNQAAARSLTLVPLVPELANYTAAVRLRGSPWNPGQLASEVIWCGSRSPEHAQEIWEMVHSAFLIAEDDDAWARFVNAEIVAWRTNRVSEQVRSRGVCVSSPAPLVTSTDGRLAPMGLENNVNIPARQFVLDLQRVIALRRRLTRREWIAYLESLLRLGLVTHTQWLCRVHSVVWQEVEDALRGRWNPEGLEARLRGSLHRPLWNIGELYSAHSTTLARQYLIARYGLNLTLFSVEQVNPEGIANLQVPTNFSNLVSFVKRLAELCTETQIGNTIHNHLTTMLENKPQVTSCRSGLTNNLREFWLYALAKRQVRLRADIEYDQGAWCQKRGGSRAPWVVQPGPLALCLAAHCCSDERGIGATVKDLQEYLMRYGVGSKQIDFIRGSLAERMRGLGIVVDSPDAEGGMGILDPLGVA